MRGTQLAGRVRRRRARADAAAEVPLERVRALDERLFELALGMGRDRLALGALLNNFAQKAWHHELGYSSLEAYALQNCGRSARWVSETRTLARRLAELPALRDALLTGRVGWSMAELVARHATPDADVALAALAAQSTVRQMRGLLSAATEREASGQVPAPALEEARAGQMSAGDGGAAGLASQMSAGMLAAAEADSTYTLSVTLNRKDALLLAWSHRFFEHLVASRQGSDFFLEAMVAEASDALTAMDHDRLIRMEDAAAAVDARRLAWLRQLEEWREESERRCEQSIPSRSARRAESDEAEGDLHERIVALTSKMAARELELARAALAFQRLDGWCRLGYASLKHYATERLGMSASSFKAKLGLARRLHAPIQEALGAGRLAYVAAAAIARVATAETAEAWVERAQRRTVKHLRQDVDVALLLGQSAPPSDAQVRHVQGLETRILQGDRSAMEEPKGQTSAGPAVCLRLRVSRDTARALRCFETVVGPRLDGSLMRFLCDKLWDAWKHVCERDEKWAHIYARDRYECTSPVCSRHDMTPHHLMFRSRGGTDDDENLAGACLWCHLEGIHGGRIEVTGTADEMTWTLGREHPLRVEGRELLSG